MIPSVFSGLFSTTKAPPPPETISKPENEATADSAPAETSTGARYRLDTAEIEAPTPHIDASLVESAEPTSDLPPAEGTDGAPGVQIHSSGLNGALTRIPKVKVIPLPVGAPVIPPPVRWRPQWPSVKTVKICFPQGMEFLPPKPEKPEKKPEKVKDPAQPLTAEDADTTAEIVPVPEGAPKKATRIKPPADAISLEDRLFFLLQPPLETWLKGQEMVMPFEPFQYQYEGIAWLFAQKAALLADEMGLGKTMQTITAMRLLLRSGQAQRILLVCPKPLIPNWQREFKTWAEELPLTTIEGDTQRRQMLWNLPGSNILLVNYELMVRDMEAFGENPPQFDLVTLDEAQRVKNRGSCTAVNARKIPRRRTWALTGTPIENRPEELASLYEFMEIIPPGGTPDLKQLQSLAKDYILRRTKDLVMTDMPPRLDRDAVLDLTPAQRLAYETAEKDGVIHLNEMGDSITIQHVFELVMRLKQIANYDPLTGDSAKFERLEADMEEVAASGGKAILFSQWTKTIDWLVEKLQRFNPLVYHGKIPTPKREPILAQFKQDPKAHIILMSYATGAVGLNLQFAGYVFLYDRWWNPAIEDQAINRAHRIGQKSQVIVTKFISKDTIEERIDRVLNEKRELFRSILGCGEATTESLGMNASEIFGLFDLKARHGKGTRLIKPAPAKT